MTGSDAREAADAEASLSGHRSVIRTCTSAGSHGPTARSAGKCTSERLGWTGTAVDSWIGSQVLGSPEGRSVIRLAVTGHLTCYGERSRRFLITTGHLTWCGEPVDGTPHRDLHVRHPCGLDHPPDYCFTLLFLSSTME